MNIDEMTKEEKSLLLFFETASVDGWAKFDMGCLNDDDRVTAEKWNAQSFVKSGRICMKDIYKKAHWCHLTDGAVEIAATLRRERANRIWEKKGFMTTAEKQGPVSA